jgi:GT2 family glycosyltransferase
VRIAVVIPTKNRPLDLVKALKSIFIQSRIPDQLVIVDQSPSNLSKAAVNLLMRENKKIYLVYIHDTKINGLVEAKQVSLKYLRSDIVLFLEDDIVLESDYIRQIELGFLRNPNMIGCSGFITNQPNSNKINKFLFFIFHRGIFDDSRMSLKHKYIGYNNKLIASDKISGGVSAWRREVFSAIKFDIYNDFHMFEDIDFSTRVFRHYGNRLFINPNARLSHYFSPIGRSVLGVKQRKKIIELFTYYKKRKDWNWATSSFLWLLFGMFLDALNQSFINKSFSPLQGFFLGFIDGIRKKIINQGM